MTETGDIFTVLSRKSLGVNVPLFLAFFSFAQPACANNGHLNAHVEGKGPSLTTKEKVVKSVSHFFFGAKKRRKSCKKKDTTAAAPNFQVFKYGAEFGSLISNTIWKDSIKTTSIIFLQKNRYLFALLFYHPVQVQCFFRTPLCMHFFSASIHLADSRKRDGIKRETLILSLFSSLFTPFLYSHCYLNSPRFNRGRDGEREGKQDIWHRKQKKTVKKKNIFRVLQLDLNFFCGYLFRNVFMFYGYLGFSISMGLQAQKSVLTRLCTRRKFPFSSAQKRKKSSNTKESVGHMFAPPFFPFPLFSRKWDAFVLRAFFFAQTRHINRFPSFFAFGTAVSLTDREIKVGKKMRKERPEIVAFVEIARTEEFWKKGRKSRPFRIRPAFPHK